MYDILTTEIQCNTLQYKTTTNISSGGVLHSTPEYENSFH